MKTSRIKIEPILEDNVDGTDYSSSKFSISPYESRGVKYLYLMQKNNGGM